VPCTQLWHRAIPPLVHNPLLADINGGVAEWLKAPVLSSEGGSASSGKTGNNLK